MARKEARIRTSVWRNTDFTGLTIAAQGTYWMLTSQPNVTLAGVLPLQPTRWARLTGDGLTVIPQALAELEERRYVVVDRATEELVIRTFVRSDEVMKSVKVRRGFWSAYLSIASDRVRAVVLEQVSDDHRAEAVENGWVSPADLDVSAGQYPIPQDPDTLFDDRASDTLSDTHARARLPSAFCLEPGAWSLEPPPPARAHEAVDDPDDAEQPDRPGGGETEPQPPTPPDAELDDRAQALADTIIAELPAHHANTIRLGAPRVRLHALLVEAVHGGWHTSEVTGAVVPGWPDNAKAPAELLADRVRKRVLARTSPTAKARNRELEQQRADAEKEAARAADEVERERLDRILDELDPAEQHRYAKAAVERMPHPVEPDLTRPSVRALARRILADELDQREAS